MGRPSLYLAYKDRIEEMWDSHTTVEISQELNLNGDTIRRYARKSGLPMENRRSWIRSSETRQKMSESAKSVSKESRHQRVMTRKASGVWHSDETKQKISSTLQGNTNRLGTGVGRRIAQGYVELRLPELIGHPLASGYGTVLEHRVVLWEKLGCETLDCQHECYKCGKRLTWGSVQGIQADHVDRDGLNNLPENLEPCCMSCNWNRDNPKTSHLVASG